MAIQSMAEYFGCDASDVFDEKQRAEGYLAGCAFATTLLAAFHEETKDKSRAYREAALLALRENI
jgi:hypothetical protein